MRPSRTRGKNSARRSRSDDDAPHVSERRFHADKNSQTSSRRREMGTREAQASGGRFDATARDVGRARLDFVFGAVPRRRDLGLAGTARSGDERRARGGGISLDRKGL